MSHKEEARWSVKKRISISHFAYPCTVQLLIPITLQGDDLKQEKEEILDSLFRKQNVPDSYSQVKDVISFILSQELSDFQRKTITFTYTSGPNITDHINMCIRFDSRHEFFYRLVDVLERTHEVGDMLLVGKQ